MQLHRRSLLKSVGTVTIGGIASSRTGTVVPGTGANSTRMSGRDEGFPPKGVTDWGDSIKMGSGKITTFSSVTPSSEPKYVGIHFAEGALEGLPCVEDFENGDAEGQKVHGFWSKLFNLDFPENTPEPISYAGCGWNPQGHTPHGVYEKPHFDLHYHFYEPETVAGIGPGTIEALPDKNTPDGYQLLEGGAVIPAMGGHLAPKDAPEFHGKEWKKTLIWGAVDADGDSEYENNFVEPMITLDYFENHLDSVEKGDIAQPEVYPKDGHYPTTYSVRDLGEGGYAVVMEDFEKHSA